MRSQIGLGNSRATNSGESVAEIENEWRKFDAGGDGLGTFREPAGKELKDEVAAAEDDIVGLSDRIRGPTWTRASTRPRRARVRGDFG
ncbi:hypothetical protein P8605_02135 [Streptomyces sp. T-3]|nr:hypothetical protein [Streptomyces sp. T-3]